MSERTALKHGQAKVQYYACREKVYQLREAGYSIQAIYDLLTKDGIITMSYKALHRNISKDRMVAEKEPKIARHSPASNPQQIMPKSSGLASPEESTRPPTGQFALPIPQQRPSSLAASVQDDRGKAMQALLDNAIKMQVQHMNDSRDDPEMERLKKTLI